MNALATPQSAFEPHGVHAARVYELTLALFIGGAVVFGLVMLFLILAMTKGRRPNHADEREPAEDEAGGVTGAIEKRKITSVAIATGATAAVLVAVLVYSIVVSRAIAWSTDERAVRIEVVGHQWWWEVTYSGKPDESSTVRTANEIHVPIGERVVIDLKSRDVIHSFWVPSLHGKVDAVPGKVNKIVLEATDAGVYRGQCAEFCGLQHAKMAFFVVAEPRPEFERWLERQRRPASSPRDPLAAQGQEVFLTHPCAMCHAVRGTKAMAAVAPDLTHIASRISVGAGALANTRGNLGGWILDPQHVKPGTRMPATHLDAESLDALLAYLESLE